MPELVKDAIQDFKSRRVKVRFYYHKTNYSTLLVGLKF